MNKNLVNSEAGLQDEKNEQWYVEVHIWNNSDIDTAKKHGIIRNGHVKFTQIRTYTVNHFYYYLCRELNGGGKKIFMNKPVIII